MRFTQNIVIPDRSAAEVFAYVSDFNRAHEWRTEVVGSTMEPTGPMTATSIMTEVAVVAGRRLTTVSRVDRFEPGHLFTFVHGSGPLPVAGEYRVEPVDGGARLFYTLDLGLTGLWKILTPIMRRNGDRVMAGSLTALRSHLTPGQPVPAS